MKLYLIKHGESEDNLEKIISGQNATTLTAVGKEQAKSLGKEFLKSGIHFDGIYSSDLNRAIETTEIICSELGVKDYFLDKRLREKHTGVLTGKYISKLTDIERIIRESASINFNEKIPGGESNYQMYIRVKEVFFDIINIYSKNSTILIIAHGGTLYNIIVRVLNLLPIKLNEWFGSCKKNIIERNSQNDNWKIIMFNDEKIGE
ncbi:MAG: histidine phosphatase family protein [Candidatus Heimdallarchaeota archaeon]|nr:histidine phosphatase family protein [Candidatus Heimdallarchaeota archaeon]